MIKRTYYCVECVNSSNKLSPLCSDCSGRIAPERAFFRYMRRFRPDFYRRYMCSSGSYPYGFKVLVESILPAPKPEKHL